MAGNRASLFLRVTISMMGGGLGEAELAVFAEDGGEVALETAVLVEEGDFGVVFHEGGDGGAGEGAVALDDDAVYFDEGDAYFAFLGAGLFVFGDVDDEAVAVFFDDGLLFGEVEGGHLEFHGLVYDWGVCQRYWL